MLIGFQDKINIFLENKLIYRGDLSLFLTDFSNKRIKLFKTYQDICNIKTI